MKKKRCFSLILTLLLCLNVILPSYASDITDTTTLESAIAETTETYETSDSEIESDESATLESETAESASDEIESTEPITEQTVESGSIQPETAESTAPEIEITESSAETEELEISDELGISTPYSTVENDNVAVTSSASPESIYQEAQTIFSAARSAIPSTYSRTSSEEMYMQLEMVIYINMLRQELGIEPVALYPELCDAAMLRANECQSAYNPNHTRPDGRECFTVLDDRNIPYSIAGENIAKGQQSVLEVMQAWWNSEEHRNNILDSSFQTVGVGMDFSTSTPTWTQIFTGGYEVSAANIYNLQDTYYVGDSLQEQGISVIIEYSNGVQGVIPLLDTMVSGYNPNQEGTQTITVQCQGMSGTFTINVTDPVKAFVSRLYTEVLGRNADQKGLNEWTGVLRSGKEQGAKVAQGFIDSNEFKQRNLSDTEYLTILYRTFFDREPDSSGLNAWLGVLDSGLSRLHVFKGFAESNEFTEICNRYGIVRGNASLTAPMDQNEGVTKFIARCYKLCLGRKADNDGLNAWCSQILTGNNTAKQAAYGFVFSNEFKSKNLSDTDFVKTMYRVFMDREADSAGLNAWVKVLQSGQSREHVFNGFADSNEFKKICASYGIQ